MCALRWEQWLMISATHSPAKFSCDLDGVREVQRSTYYWDLDQAGFSGQNLSSNRHSTIPLISSIRPPTSSGEGSRKDRGRLWSSSEHETPLWRMRVRDCAAEGRQCPGVWFPLLCCGRRLTAGRLQRGQARLGSRAQGVATQAAWIRQKKQTRGSKISTRTSLLSGFSLTLHQSPWTQGWNSRSFFRKLFHHPKLAIWQGWTF